MLLRKFLLIFLCMPSVSIKPTISEFLENVKDGLIDAGKATLETAQATAGSVKESTWDAKAFGHKNGGKYITSLVLATLAADYAYTYYVNKSKAYYETKRPTIHERIKNYWDSIDEYYRNLIINTSVTIGVSAILWRIQMGSTSEDHLEFIDPFDLQTEGTDKIIGFEKAKKQIARVEKYHENPDKYKKLGATPSKGILLHGPPGNGKTEFARAIAKDRNSYFCYITGSDFNGIYRGTGSAQMRKIEKFVAKHKDKKIVLFVDEIDAAVGKSSGHGLTHLDDQATTNKFKTFLDGLIQNDNVFVVGATNNLNLIDEAIIRPGRLEAVYIGTPSKDEFREILKLKFKNRKIDENLNIDSIVDRYYQPGYTGAHAEALAKNAAWCAVENEKEKIDDQSVDKAISEIKEINPSFV